MGTVSIGAWVGVIYNQAENDRIQETTNFFRDVFREDKSFDSFPLNTVFTPDWAGNAEAMWGVSDRSKNLQDYILAERSYEIVHVHRVGAETHVWYQAEQATPILQ